MLPVLGQRRLARSFDNINMSCDKAVDDRPLPKKKARQAKILTELGIFPEMRVKDLADRLGVSAETIRRDLTVLAKEGTISRTFGGAVGKVAAVPGIEERKNLMIPERDRISAVAAKMIEPNDLLMVGGGSTTMRFALALLRLEFPVTIVTHSLPFATSVSKNRNISVELLPGRLIPNEGLTTGTNTLRAIEKFATHKAVVGASGINERGVYALLEPGEVYAAMIESADKALLLIDSSKFGATALSLYGVWSSKLTLITDSRPSLEITAALEDASVDVLLA